MSKTDLVSFIAEASGLTKADASRALEAMIEGVETGLKKDGKVTITGFATFTKKFKEEKEGRNPRTGEVVKIPARMAVTIKPGTKLKEALN